MRDLLADNLELEGYRVAAVGSAEEALQRIERHSFALILLDVMLPRASGFELCRTVRARDARIPIIMLTARTDETDRVLGLDLGADDYVSKPFSVRELLARVRAQLRREGVIGEPDDERVRHRRHSASTSAAADSVTRRNRHLELSPHEFELLRYLIAHRGEVVSREQLLRDVWGYSAAVGDAHGGQLHLQASQPRRAQAARSPIRPHRARQRIPSRRVSRRCQDRAQKRIQRHLGNTN